MRGGVVITNPPFSKIREFIDVLLENKVKFLIIAPKLVIKYKKVFEGIKNKEIFVGYSLPDTFIRPDGSIKSAPCIWLTNLEIDLSYKKLELTKKYNEKEYIKLDNYDAINVDKTKDIPIDYYDYIAVPITFLIKNDYKLFDIIEILGRDKFSITRTKIYSRNEIKQWNDLNAGGVININNTLKVLFARIIIKRKQYE